MLALAPFFHSLVGVDIFSSFSVLLAKSSKYCKDMLTVVNEVSKFVIRPEVYQPWIMYLKMIVHLLNTQWGLQCQTIAPE
jgi:hypothetical protein